MAPGRRPARAWLRPDDQTSCVATSDNNLDDASGEDRIRRILRSGWQNITVTTGLVAGDFWPDARARSSGCQLHMLARVCERVADVLAREQRQRAELRHSFAR